MFPSRAEWSPAPPPGEDDWMAGVAKLPPDKQIEVVAAQLKKRNPDFAGKVTPRIDGGAVTELTLLADDVTDLTPLRALPAPHILTCNGSAKGKGKLADLKSLSDLRLTALSCDDTQVHDLSPLQGLPLVSLSCRGTPVTSLAPLKGLPLKQLSFDYRPGRDLALLRALALETINDKPAAEFWKELDARRTALDAWVKSVPALVADKQAEAVAAKLQELNPDFNGKYTPKIVGGAVVEFGFVADDVTDLAPLRGLTKLQTLACAASAGQEPAGRPDAAQGIAAQVAALRRHEGRRPDAAQGHVADPARLREHRRRRPDALEDNAAPTSRV